MEAASHRKTPECEYDAYCKIIDYADMLLAVYDPAAARDGIREGAGTARGLSAFGRRSLIQRLFSPFKGTGLRLSSVHNTGRNGSNPALP